MKATAILAVIAATAASPSLGEQLAETFAGEWTSVGELTHAAKGEYAAVRMLGHLDVAGNPSLSVTSACTGWQSWDGRSGGICTLTDGEGDAYWVEYRCDRADGWPPPPSCEPAYWRTTQCGQMVPLPDDVHFVCDGTTVVRGGLGKYAALAGRGRMQLFRYDSVGEAARGFAVVETSYRSMD